ncbi:flagellar protein [Afipia massiliensis]|uniref:Flagellin n=1 Tax=Afipia massiliensis TaxID=211460 RepID=A0A4U6BTP5_9BRAD|nr:flagellin [Afipia massiliensis]TKT72458.1 flagellar protein [Afipia massiliensis]
MSDIVLSASVRQNLLSLQATADLLATTQNRLATGKKVNSALDNPTNYFTAAGLDARASDINNLLDGIGNGVQVLQAANTGITSLQKLIDSAKSIANQALQTNVGYAKSSLTTGPNAGATGANLLGLPDTAATVTGIVVGGGLTPATTLAAAGFANGDSFTINGKTISFVTGLAADPASTTDPITGNVSISLSSATGGTVATILSAINGITGGTSSIAGNQLTVSNAVADTANSITFGGTSSALAKLGLSTGTTPPTYTFSGKTLTIPSTAGGPATNIVFGNGVGQVSTINQLNAALLPNNLQASIDSTGAITITTSNDAASSTIGVIGGTATAPGELFAGVIVSAPVAEANSQATRANLVTQYNNIIQQIKTTSQDASFNGVNLLNGDQLKLVFNETGKSTLNITGINLDPAGLGLGNLSAGVDFIDNVATNKVLDSLNYASSFLRSQASTLGSNLSIVQIRQDFSKNLINVLQSGSANLTIADSNEEAANSQALSTRQSIAVSALALANQSQQSVLQLLRT